MLARLLTSGIFSVVGMLAILLSANPLHAQDVENATSNLETRNLQISGGLQLSNNFYFSNGIDPRRDALQWRALANLNLRYLGISAPFSLAFSDGNQEFNLPSYTFAGISPTYKWATLHLGDRSLNYSKYTLNSINFRGAGFELEPGNFYVSGMYGRLRRARAEDLNSLQALDPSYERTGYGIKTGYKNKGSEYSLIFFAAEDDENSITQPVAVSISPAQNMVASAIAKQRLVKNLSVEAEYAHSVTNDDRRLNALTDEDVTNGNSLLGLFNPNETITDGDAIRTRLVYSPKRFSTNLGYERIDRGFRTLGALFFLSDAEYYTAGFSTALFENKLTLFANGGLENTNLDDFEQNGTRRAVGSINASYVPNDKWIYSASYSNFENTTRLRAISDPSLIVDSILLAQTTNTGNLTSTYNLTSDETRTSSITMILSYQQARSIIDDVVQEDADSRFFNGSLMYTTNLTEQDLRFTAALNYNQTELELFNNNTISPTVAVSKGFLERQLQTQLRATYNLVSQDSGPNSNVLNLTVGASYNFLEDHNISFTNSFINRSSSSDDIPNFSEWYGRISYGYRFGADFRLY
ncbi:MAG: hypothetical protein AAFZ63_13170 [Bacteroidota bacterium]